MAPKCFRAAGGRVFATRSCRLCQAGIAGLMYGKLGYTTETHEAKLGSLELSIQEKRTVNVPL